VLDQMADPEIVLARVDHLYAHPEEVSTDEVRLKDGRIMERWSGPVRLASGELDGRLWLFRDVTERRRAEARRLDFYSIIAHDLRSPLAAVTLLGERILRGRRGEVNDEIRADLETIKRRVGALGALIDDFGPLIENTGQDLRVDAEQRGVVTMGDRRRLQQVVANLVANAIKFTPPLGVITISARTVDAWCEVSILDEGTGIADDVVPQLFQRYTRGPATASESVGTGLGLLIVREIVEAHGGTVGVVSQLGKGSRFWFRLPREEAAA